MIIGFLVLINPYPIMHIADLNNYNYLISENTNETEINLSFDKSYINNYYSKGFSTVFLNLYTNEFKNNETIENISALQLGNCYFSVDKLAYSMSFVVSENCFYENVEHIITINKTDNLIINKIELEYEGSDYKNKTTKEFIQLFSLLVILFSIIITLFVLKR